MVKLDHFCIVRLRALKLYIYLPDLATSELEGFPGYSIDPE